MTSSVSVHKYNRFAVNVQTCSESNLGENMVDIRVHQSLLVSVLGHPQDLGGDGRERWDGDVHVVSRGH